MQKLIDTPGVLYLFCDKDNITYNHDFWYWNKPTSFMSTIREINESIVIGLKDEENIWNHIADCCACNYEEYFPIHNVLHPVHGNIVIPHFFLKRLPIKGENNV